MAKKQKKPRKPMQVWKIYDSKSGALTRKTVSCPKCGPGVFLGKHASRLKSNKFLTRGVSPFLRLVPRSSAAVGRFISPLYDFCRKVGISLFGATAF